jgi:transcriptional regulator GlxA family with amidase domain
MSTVAAVIDQGALTFDLAIPCEVFGVDRRDIVEPWYELLVVAAGTTPVRTQTGFAIDTPHRLEALEQAQTIVVPGWSDPDVPASAALCSALRDAHGRGARIVSLCTGAFVLADAGLLERERLRLPQRLLETCGDPLPVVARTPGYESETTMRAQFTSRLGTSPRAYRQTFGRTAARS